MQTPNLINGLIQPPQNSSSLFMQPGTISPSGQVTLGTQPAPISAPKAPTSNPTSVPAGQTNVKDTPFYALQPGESLDNYYKRTQGQTQQQALAQTQPTFPGQGNNPPPQPQPQLAPNTQGQNTQPQFQTNPSATFPSLVGGLAGLSAQPTPQFTNAQNQYLEANKALAALNTEVAQQTANIGESRTNLAEAGGEQGLLQNLYAGKQAALTGEMTAAQAAAQVATGQQQAQQQGLGAAAGLFAPQAYSPTNVPFNPSTGQFGQPGISAFGGGGAASLGAFNTQINQGGDVQAMTSSLKQTSGLISKAKQDIASSGFNPTPFALGNAVTYWLNNNVITDPAYTNVINDLSEIANTIAPVLGVPGNPTNVKTIIAQELVPRLMAGQDLGTVLDNLEANANIKIDQARQASQSNAINQGSAGTSDFFNQNWFQ